MPSVIAPSMQKFRLFISIAVLFLLLTLYSFRSKQPETSSWRTSIGNLLVNTPDGEDSTPGPLDGIELESEQQKYHAITVGETFPESTTRSEAAVESTPTSTSPSISDPCRGFPGTGDILVIMKTGATEAYDKMPIHLMSTLKCVKDSFLVSDIEMDMAGYHFVDVLADFPKELQKDNQDFELYRRLQEYKRLHQDPRALNDANSGWYLDKYKFIPMLQKTWEYRKNADWYVFIEADTSVSWDNLRLYLDMLDPERPYYIGSPTSLDIEFAHGGTGYVISNAAMRKAVAAHPELGEKYNKEVNRYCCGDRMIARVFLDENILLTRMWPLFNGENPLTLPFQSNQWCQPFLTMHHMTADQISQVWDLERQRKIDGIKIPTTWKDIFNAFVLPGLEPQRANWDNLSYDLQFTADPKRPPPGRDWASLTPVEQAAGEGPTQCKKLCEETTDCYQWLHRQNECHLGHSIKVGKARAPQRVEKWKNGQEDVIRTSGWNFARIGEFRQRMGECARGVQWQPDNI